LTTTGIRKGDRVAIWAPNSAEWIVAALGIALSGAVLVPLNTRLKGREAAFILRRSGARLLLTVGEFLGTRYPELLAGESLPALDRHRAAGRNPASLELAGVPRDWRRHPGAAETVSRLDRAISPTSCSRRARPDSQRAS
jgi:acyl-CoA synthetase (AMP-forming)/AMP-acid ligase II